jgi:molecular chaperone GrpE
MSDTQEEKIQAETEEEVQAETEEEVVVAEEGKGEEPEVEVVEDAEESAGAANGEAALAAAQAEAVANYDRYLRAVAELDNFRKRTARMRMEVREDTLRDVLLQVAPPLDNMRRALGQETEDVEVLKQGIELIYTQFQDALNNYGLEQIEALGSLFDPNLHEAMVEVEDGEKEPGTVIEEMEKGYTLNGKVVRPTRVILSKAPSEGE